MTWTTDADGSFVHEQPDWAAFTGQTLQGYQGFGWVMALHPEDRASTAAAWNEAVTKGTICEVEYRVRRHDGVYRWFQVRAAPVVGDDGAIREWIGMESDITERRTAEASLCDLNDELATQNRLLQEQGLELEMVNAELQSDAAEIEAQTEEAQALSEELREANTLLEASVREATAARVAAEAGRQRLAAVLNNLPDAATVLDEDWRIAFTNPPAAAVMRMLGTDPEAVVGRVLWDVFPWMPGTKFASETRRAMAEHRLVEYEEYAAPLARWFETRIVPMPDGGIVSYARDVTERRRATQAVRDASAMLEGLMANVGDAVYIKGLDGRYLAMNAAGASMAGLTPAEIVGKRDSDLIGPVQAARTHDADQRVLQTGQEDRLEDRFTVAGEQRTFLTVRNPYRDADGTIVGIVGIATDITERRRREDDLRVLDHASRVFASSLDFDKTLAAAAQLVVPDLADWCSVVLRDEGGGLRTVAVAHVDPAKVAWAREVGDRYPEDPNAPTGVANVLRTGVSEMYNDISPELVASAAKDAEHARLLGELRLRSALIVPMSSRRRVLGAITLVSAESGRRYDDATKLLAEELGRRAGVAVDNAHLYREANEARAEAEAANRAKTDFLAQMSHELRTPLNAIRGYAELLEIGVHGPSTDPQKDALLRIRRSEGHLLTLINDILDYAKLEVGHSDPVIEPLPLNDVLAGIEALVGPQMVSKGVRYEYRPGSPDDVVLADRDRLSQIVINLLSNALKATATGGAVTMWYEVEKDIVRLRVRDTGIGIPEDKLDVIFEPFVQLDQGLTRTTRGAGLGLAISRGLARAMNGDVTVVSALGTGSTFELTLPRG
ncbi:MAG: hypothetical protein NVS1B4_14890 [Gemmatimonadaceae bacterium]